MSQPDIGEQAISKAAEVGIESQLDESENVEVDIRTDPGKIVQGELESVKIEGDGMVMQDDLRTEKLEIKTNSIKINPLKAAFGDIELEQPTDATAQVVLLDQDLEKAFNSDYIKEKLQNFTVQVDDKPVEINTRQIGCQLPGEGKVSIDADVMVGDSPKQVKFTAVPTLDRSSNTVNLEQLTYQEGKDLSPELTEALVDTAQSLLDLNNFELEGMSLEYDSLDVQPGKIILNFQALFEEFPD